jgi:hypothetical protein
MGVKSMVHFLLKVQQKILLAKVGIAPCMSPDNAIYKIGLSRRIGELILVRGKSNFFREFVIPLLNRRVKKCLLYQMLFPD